MGASTALAKQMTSGIREDPSATALIFLGSVGSGVAGDPPALAFVGDGDGGGTVLSQVTTPAGS